MGQHKARLLSQPSLSGSSSASRKSSWKVSAAIKSSRVPERKPDRPVQPGFGLIPPSGCPLPAQCGGTISSPLPGPLALQSEIFLGSFELEEYPLCVFGPDAVLGDGFGVLGAGCGTSVWKVVVKGRRENGI